MIEVITGTMFSGKTTELSRRLQRAQIAQRRVVAFTRDTRWCKSNLRTHDGSASIPARYTPSSERLREELHRVWSSGGVDVIGIDEVQFFDDSILEPCNKLSIQGVKIIVSGLDSDFRGEPFWTTLRFCSVADRVDRLLAVCSICGHDAVMNHRLSDSEEVVLEGDRDLYMALCREHWSEFQRGEEAASPEPAVSSEETLTRG